jgi:hypothetical protein
LKIQIQQPEVKCFVKIFTGGPGVVSQVDTIFEAHAGRNHLRRVQLLSVASRDKQLNSPLGFSNAQPQLS